MELSTYGDMHKFKSSPGINRKSRVSYPGSGFLSSATWPSLQKKHYYGLNQTKRLQYTTWPLLICMIFFLGYYMGAGMMESRLGLLSLQSHSFSWMLMLAVSIALPVCSLILIFYWSRRRWSNHPIAASLSVHAGTGSSWMSVGIRPPFCLLLLDWLINPL